MVFDRSTATVRSMSPGNEAASRGSSAFTPSTAWMMLAPGWRDKTTSDARFAVDQAGVAQILDRVENLGDVGEPDRRRRCGRR